MGEREKNTVVLAADHGGFALKEQIKDAVSALGYAVCDLGVGEESPSVDYPDYAHLLAKRMGDPDTAFGILVCGSGIGMSIAANRYPGIRAALCYDRETAHLAREHNNANVLVMGGRLIDVETALACVRIFATTPFAGGRHARRVSKFDTLHLSGTDT